MATMLAHRRESDGKLIEVSAELDKGSVIKVSTAVHHRRPSRDRLLPSTVGIFVSVFLCIP